MLKDSSWATAYHSGQVIGEPRGRMARPTPERTLVTA